MARLARYGLVHERERRFVVLGPRVDNGVHRGAIFSPPLDAASVMRRLQTEPLPPPEMSDGILSLYSRLKHTPR